MTAPGGHSPAHAAGPPVAPDDRRATIAGAVLVVAAVVVGVILLAKGFSDGGGLGSKTKKSATTSTTAATGAGGATTTTAPIDPASVHVFVANASGKSGAASRAAQVLVGKSYPAPATGNAPTSAATVVYYTTGQKAQAELVAQSLGLAVSSVAPMPNPPPVTNLQGATVLVMIGTDGALDTVEGGTSTTAKGTTSSTAHSTTTTKKP